MRNTRVVGLVLLLSIALVFHILGTIKLSNDLNDLPSLLSLYNHPIFNQLLEWRKRIENSETMLPFNDQQVTASVQCSMKFVVFSKSWFSSTSSGSENSHHEQLLNTLKSILKLRNFRIFIPCITVVVDSTMNEKKNSKLDLETILQKQLNLNQQELKVSNSLQELNNNEFESWKQSQQPFSTLIYLVEEGYEFCERSLYHLMNIAKEAAMKKKKRNVYRASTGIVNGLIFNDKIMNEFLNKLIMEASTKKNPTSRFVLTELLVLDFLKKKDLYMHRWQLMTKEEIPKQNVNVHQPQCYETLIDPTSLFSFDVDRCKHSKFSPCERNDDDLLVENELNSKNKFIDTEFVHDTAQEVIFPATSKLSLSQLQQAESVLAELGSSCDQACVKKGMKCNREYFPYINRCDEFKQYHHLRCECLREEEATSRAPYLNQERCMIALRRSAFRCDSRPKDKAERRLCPCSPKETS
ncbi:hypothetical protein FDP41_007957 [Naegleria fowleri]|uniref:Glycosyltransferase family 18 catalytic domain-containing protein n=1 Tax=Naegleria fowleri TaxID=5763 RepID=A0A6A5CAM5_NAEFO|nr:uncharacterized protein FDP41_007957 [Naegleria fowleri]KAF0984042.1 hypothetical protein FDP41_007957 [Naegleria fowleri]